MAAGFTGTEFGSKIDLNEQPHYEKTWQQLQPSTPQMGWDMNILTQPGKGFVVRGDNDKKINDCLLFTPDDAAGTNPLVIPPKAESRVVHFTVSQNCGVLHDVTIVIESK